MSPSYAAVLSLVILLVPLAACADRPAEPGLARPATHPWLITSIDGAPALAGRDRTPPTLEIGAGLAGGSTGVNHYHGTVVLDATTVTFSRMISTRMMGPPPLAAQEQAYLRALAAIRTWAIDGDELRLSDADGAVRLTAK
jgi:heat shock protein HslJ